MKEQLKIEQIKLEQLKLKILKYKIFYYKTCLKEKPEFSISFIKTNIMRLTH